jgi:hypothetical protein
MNDFVANLISAATLPVRQRVAVGARVAALMLIAIVAALVAGGFAVAALTMWLAPIYGPPIAALIVGAGFAGLAIILMAVALSTGKSGNSESAGASRQARTAAPFADIPGSAASPGDPSIVAGLKLLSQLKPWELVGLAVVAGFLAGRGRPRKESGNKPGA